MIIYTYFSTAGEVCPYFIFIGCSTMATNPNTFIWHIIIDYGHFKRRTAAILFQKVRKGVNPNWIGQDKCIYTIEKMENGTKQHFIIPVQHILYWRRSQQSRCKMVFHHNPHLKVFLIHLSVPYTRMRSICTQ